MQQQSRKRDVTALYYHARSSTATKTDDVPLQCALGVRTTLPVEPSPAAKAVSSRAALDSPCASTTEQLAISPFSANASQPLDDSDSDFEDEQDGGSSEHGLPTWPASGFWADVGANAGSTHAVPDAPAMDLSPDLDGFDPLGNAAPTWIINDWSSETDSLAGPSACPSEDDEETDKAVMINASSDSVMLPWDAL